MREHRSKHYGFTSQYKICKLIYFEDFGTLIQARFRENQIKGYSRIKKLRLVWEKNPRTDDLEAIL
jgi:putative endonuclease